MMVFRKLHDQRSHRRRDQTLGCANSANGTPKQSVPMHEKAEALRVDEKSRKMCSLRKAVRAVFCPRREKNSDLTNLGDLDEKSSSNHQCYTVDCQPASPSHQESPTPDQTLQAESPLQQVAVDKSPHQATTLGQCQQAVPDQPAVTGKACQQIHATTSEDGKTSKGSLLSCASLHALSQMTSQQLQDYLTVLSAPAKNKKKPDCVKATKSSTDSAYSGSEATESSSTCTSPPLPQDKAAPPSSVIPEVVYHPHLGCRMYKRSEIKPAAVDQNGQQGLVGEGAFAQVTAVRLPDDTVAAAKVLQAQDSEGPLWQEIIAVAALGEHPSFPKLYGVVEQQPLRTMLYEFVGDKDTLSVTTLQDALDWNGTPAALSRKNWLRIVRNVCEGLLHMHNNDYVHCDIKPDNVLLYSVKEGKKTRWFAKIKHFIDQMYQECPQMAPEVMEGDSPFNKPAEIYALGDLLINIGKAAGIWRLRRTGKRCQHIDFRKRPTMAQVWKKLSKHWK
ncbi:uncharacterized protein LOC110986107 [Acanthaster planci]|uniref:Uncharacterized protein LOC110986107 n=1 Tax=Acanthaster planci TaxID=133434 RepID=A0A8B7ZJG8_ACAPL|nr:uncharacterized protein LOC110986107 [Acanthaster planci]